MDEWKTKITNVKRPEVMSREACLVMIYPPSATMGQRFALKAGESYIGRGSDCEIQVDFDSVSRRHALIRRQGAAILVEDLDSTNGTYVNEEAVKRQALANGDLVQVGNTIFKFLIGGNVETDYHEAIYRMTIIDALTGAHNKRFMLEFIEREMARSLRYNRPLSVAMFDLDHFKEVNDTHGHLTGDQVLRELSRRISNRIRREELLARYGGEEFVVVLPETDHEGAMAFAEQLRDLSAKTPVTFEGNTIRVTISVGVATSTGQMMDTNAFIKVADDNLYRAKRSGRNRVVG
ncbi:MAG: GGDEF domain-containing protein [Deltaproteobacteria bacterium]|nr:GGDEF domain-containing protein [Deltaproteobacteria bacterium]